MKCIYFLKEMDIYGVRRLPGYIHIVNDMDKINGDIFGMCIGHGSYIQLKIGEEVAILNKKRAVEMKEDAQLNDELSFNMSGLFALNDIDPDLYIDK